MFQADSDFYQQYAADGTWQATEQVIQGGELLFRTREGEEEAGDEGQTEMAQPEPQTEDEDADQQTEAGTETVQICESQTE